MILVNRSNISANASSGFFSPKNRIDQRPFNIRCKLKASNAFLVALFLALVFHIRPAETPIRVYKVVHTGPNIQFGGLKKGLLMSTYQVLMESTVKNPEPPPTNKQINTHSKGLKK
jgi:hypothetical protein